ncbi:MAG: HlyD family secretion protein [Kiritimatiellae bacterium]|nr:HlyD family secretion protein [Kiritimatiellia bacterium]
MVTRRQRLPRHPRVIWSRLKYKWPLLVWLAAIWGCLVLYRFGVRTIRIPGVVEALREEDAPVESARLVAVHVAPGDRVVPGQVLAVFDSSLADAELAVERLQAERQFKDAIQAIAERRRELRLREASERRRLEVLDAELARVQSLIAASVEDAARLAYLRAEREAIAQTLALYPAELAELEREEAEARQRWEEARRWMEAGEGASSSTPPAGMEAYAAALSVARARRENFILRARHTGIVTRVWFQPGDVVPAGTPTITLLIENRQRVTGFLSEYVTREVREGMEAFVEPAHGGLGSRLTPARIVTVSPDITWLPTRVSPIRNQTIRGRRIEVKLSEPIAAVPGEAVNIYVGRPWWSEAFERFVPERWKAEIRRRRGAEPSETSAAGERLISGDGTLPPTSTPAS